MLLVAASLTGHGAWAQAQDDVGTPSGGVGFDEADKAQTFQATQLYRGGIEAQKRGKHDEALRLFRESYGVVRSPNSRMMIVRELGALGRYVEGYREGVAAVAEAEQAAATAPDKYGKTIEAAKAELAAIERNVALVVVNVSRAPEGAALVVNGRVVNQEDWGRPIPVDAGEVIAALTTTEGELVEKTEALSGKTVEIAIAPPAPEVEDDAPPPPPPPVVEESDSLWPSDWPSRRVIGIVAGATGALALINFGIFGLLSDGQADRLQAGCPNVTDCNAALADEADKGRTYQTLANVFLVVGLVGVSAGAGFFTWDLLDDGDDADQAGAPESDAKLSLGPGSIIVTGSF